MQISVKATASQKWQLIKNVSKYISCLQSHGKIRPQVLVLDANKSLEEMTKDYSRYEDVLLGRTSLPSGLLLFLICHEHLVWHSVSLLIGLWPD
jgi:hypothetical protein